MKLTTALSLALLLAATLVGGCDKPQPPPQPQVNAAETIFM